MAIVSRSSNNEVRTSGSVRAYHHYTLTDGRTISRGPLLYSSVDEADAALISNEASVLAVTQQSDARDAFSKGITTPHGEASQQQVWSVWLHEGFAINDPLESYRVIERVATPILALGLTVEEMAQVIGVSTQEAQATLDRWTYLEANAAAVAAYDTVKGGL